MWHDDPSLARIARQRVIWQRPQGRENMISLRRDDLDTRFPGLMAILLQVK
jgi:hypothetical protein